MGPGGPWGPGGPGGPMICMSKKINMDLVTSLDKVVWLESSAGVLLRPLIVAEKGYWKK